MYPGGISDKQGNRYEELWTVLHFLRVLRGEQISITVEKLGNENDGFEFYVEDADGVKNSIKVFRKPAPNKIDEFGQKAEFDYNKAYGVLNNANEIILIQYYIFDPILKEIDYFR